MPMEFRDQVLTRLIEMLEGKGNVPRMQITPQTHFVNDLSFDSLERVEFVMKVEDEFGVTVSGEEADKLATVADVADAIIEKNVEKSSP
jgi:acyl carrier protein